MLLDRIKNWEDLYIPTTPADICQDLTEGTNNVYKNLPYPFVNSIGKGYAYVFLYDIIEYAFSDPKHLPAPLLPLPTPPMVRRIVERNCWLVS